MIKNDKKQDKRYIITFLIRNDARYCSPTIDAVDTWAYLRIEMVIKDLVILFFFLPFFIIYLTVKWFMTNSKWFTVSLKTPAPQVSV